ncbi:hypothetical protein [Pedobacter cryoconitis]|uniref:Uncharacterized protein n=1 Tax=Pedobacter cryoconitis TaxID=188932 RepID=A0A7X0MKU4_9SPHI|nr:hypothetical protein [Pedobacter cryoconitis]MBB6502426.1 hypothetical protein [Pedobacter cryoconitis]
MQSSVQLRISSELPITTNQLIQTIDQYAEQVAYMLQAYHPHEKASGVEVMPESMSHTPLGLITLELSYQLEQFNVCRAIDAVRREKMVVSVFVDQQRGELELRGEYWPERETD